MGILDNLRTAVFGQPLQVKEAPKVYVQAVCLATIDVTTSKHTQRGLSRKRFCIAALTDRKRRSFYTVQGLSR